MNSEIFSAIERIHGVVSAPKITFGDAVFVFDTINKYFGDYERSQEFRGADIKLSKRFHEFLEFFGREQGVIFTSQFFLFCYTLAQDYKQVQNPIYENVALPYQNWVSNKWGAFAPVVKNITRGDEYVFICRHAVTVGAYAPGSSIYTFANALLDANRKVSIISLGQVSEQFGNLSKQHSELKIYTIKNAPLAERFLSLIELLNTIEPNAILTEVEFDIVSVLSILKPELPTIFLSPGFYKVPWFDKIGVTDTLALDENNFRRNDFFDIPTYVSERILDPVVDEKKISILRSHLGLNHNDFVIGSFARMEKFQTPFLKVIGNVLDNCPTVKVVLAGPNDRSPVENALKRYIALGRAAVLPTSDVHALGHLVTLGIDTFPTHSGFSVLELMAKGVPVVAKRGVKNHINMRQRIPDLVCEDESSLVELICKLVQIPDMLEKYRHSSKELVVSKSNDKRFLCALDRTLLEA